MEEAIIKSKIEMAELQTQMAAADAKIKVLTNNSESQGDVMNDYYDANMEDNVEPTFAIEFAPVTAIPKTPESS